MSSQVVDRGRVCIVVEKFPKKENGQPVLDGNGMPIMGNKYMSIGDATKWRKDDGSENVTQKVFLQPVANVHCIEQIVFWESESNQNQGKQQQATQNQYQQSNGQPMNPQQVQQQQYQR